MRHYRKDEFAPYIIQIADYRYNLLQVADGTKFVKRVTDAEGIHHNQYEPVDDELFTSPQLAKEHAYKIATGEIKPLTAAEKKAIEEKAAKVKHKMAEDISGTTKGA